MVKSTTTPRSSEMNFESCPPISKIVSGTRPSSIRCPTKVAPVLWAVISSLTVSAPISAPISSRPEPVVPAPRITSRSPHSLSICRSASATTSMGLPCVRV